MAIGKKTSKKRNIKKAIGISVLICILLSCVSLCACSLQGIIDKIIPTTAAEPKDEPWQVFEGVIETTVTDSNGNEITISHTDNFTEDDIEFVLMFNGNKKSGSDQVDAPFFLPLSVALDGAKNNNEPIFLLYMKNPYVICAYQKPDMPNYEKDEDGYYYFDVTKYVWGKFSAKEVIPDTFEGMTKTDSSYLIYDCVVKKDIVSGNSYEKQCKYYWEYRGKGGMEITRQKMLVYYVNSTDAEMITGDYKYIKSILYLSVERDVYTNESGKEYLYFKHESYQPDGSIYQNYSQDEFREYYDILSSHFEVLEEKSSNNKVVSYAGIDLDTLIDEITSS